MKTKLPLLAALLLTTPAARAAPALDLRPAPVEAPRVYALNVDQEDDLQLRTVEAALDLQARRLSLGAGAVLERDFATLDPAALVPLARAELSLGAGLSLALNAALDGSAGGALAWQLGALQAELVVDNPHNADFEASLDLSLSF